MIKFEFIEYLNLLYIIPIIILIIYWLSIWKKNQIKLFGDHKLVNKLMLSYSKFNVRVKNSILIFSLALIIIALSNPQIGNKLEEVKRKGVDLMIAIDLSNSMLVEDIKPNRLERSKLAISKLIDNLQGDRIGIVVFAGEAYVQLPITTDYSAAKMFLSSVNTDLIISQGTKIGTAIEKCIKSFDIKNQQNKAIIIITDGESHDEEAIAKAKEAVENDIFVHTLGMGLEKGGPIPNYNTSGKIIDYRKDNNEKIIVSKLNQSLLEDIAIAGNGIYIRANNTQSGLQLLFEEINKMEKKEIGTYVFTEYKDRFQIFLVLALLLIFLEILISNSKSKILKNEN